MWTCPKCGREFKRTNQGHYCGKAPESVEAYIASQMPQAQPHCTELRELIRHSVPKIHERIAWSMPLFEKGLLSISFAACKKHISLYLDTEIIERLRPQLNGFEIKKNALYLPYDRPLPKELLGNAIKQYFETTPCE